MIFIVCFIIIVLQIIEFNGNIDSHKIVENSLSCPVIARYIRVMPSSWNNYISMKIDLRGCALNHGKIVNADICLSQNLRNVFMECAVTEGTDQPAHSLNGIQTFS